MFAYILYQTGSFLARILPLRVAEIATRLIGEVNCVLRRRTRRVVMDNLRIVHGGRLTEEELRRKSRAVISNFARCILVLLRIPAYEWEDLKTKCNLDSFIEAASGLGGRKNFVITTAHVGPWELGGLVLSRLGYKVHTVALDHPSKMVTRFFDQRRRQVGVLAYPVENSFAVLKEALESGGVVALLTDRAHGRSRKRYEFFGVGQDFPTGYLALSVRCSVPVLTAAFLFDGKDRFNVVLGGVHYPPEDGDESGKIDALQEKCLRDLERIIEEHSEQWFHFRPLVKRG